MQKIMQPMEKSYRNLNVVLVDKRTQKILSFSDCVSPNGGAAGNVRQLIHLIPIVLIDLLRLTLLL
eukprot:SAG31_NODE_14262_length_818_cov_0.634214_2_plen_66_part_01